MAWFQSVSELQNARICGISISSSPLTASRSRMSLMSCPVASAANCTASSASSRIETRPFHAGSQKIASDAGGSGKSFEFTAKAVSPQVQGTPCSAPPAFRSGLSRNIGSRSGRCGIASRSIGPISPSATAWGAKAELIVTTS
jgi:hypothetical protein